MKKEMFWVLVAALLAVLMVSPVVSQVNFTVNSTGDGGDSNLGDGACDDGTGDCTLRAAIEQANALPGRARIGFNIPGVFGTVRIIQPTTPLPRILEPVIINGYTQLGASPPNTLLIVLDGSLISSAAGLQMDGGNSTVRGLVINNFVDGTGIVINSDENAIEGNYIGMDAASTIPQPNSVGISIFAANNRIGGNTFNARNIISGNNEGIIMFPGAFGNRVQGNWIGIDALGGTYGNSSGGVYLRAGVFNNVIGGINSDQGNTIAFNGGDGGVILFDSGAGNAILSNIISSNAGLGIDLGLQGVTANDDGDGDTGPNNLQNFPVLTSAVTTNVGGVGTRTRIEGTLNSTPNTRFRLEFFASSACDPSDHGEADQFIGSTRVTTESDGNAQFTANLTNPATNSVSPGQFITATATEVSGRNTSEFSQCIEAGAVYVVNSTGDNADSNVGDGTCDDGTGDCTLRAAIEEANAVARLDAIIFSIPSAGPHTIQPASALPPITKPATINGYTEQGAAPATRTTPATLMIELDGSIAGSGTNGLEISLADNCLVRGLVINRFDGAGINLLSSNNLIHGNYIGTDVGGTAALGNGTGIAIDGNNNRIGTRNPRARNLISGNVANGIEIEGDGNVVQGNFIGTDKNGTTSLGNGSDGVCTTQSGSPENNRIGGIARGAGNLISGNTANGISLFGVGDIVQGNFIGTDKTGTVALGNSENGVLVHGDNISIGGPTRRARNIISANGANGIKITFATGTAVKGNFIGTDVTGTVVDPDGIPFSGDELGNSENGVEVTSVGDNNTIGGTTPGARNIISGNRDGIDINTGATGNQVQGNYVGTDVTGTIDLGNFGEGVSIHEGASNNTIGGTTPEAGNLISGNGHYGVNIFAGADFNLVQGNLIGTDKNGTSSLGNDGGGVRMGSPGTLDNTLGGTASGAGNIIAFNGDDGVFIDNTNTNAILSNSIFSNDGLGIDLDPDGVTANDAGDGDTGANNLQNFPILTSAITDGSSITIDGTLNSTSNTTFTLEFFANPVCDPSDHGEGESFIGSTTETTDGSGDATFTINFSSAVPAGQFVTATATDPNNNTSEFCECIDVLAGVPKQNVSPGDEPAAPLAYSLSQNYPNPFNPSTTISYSLKKPGEVKITIFDLLGQKVRSLVQGHKSAGRYSVRWDGRNEAGRPVSSGTYFYRLKAGEAVQTRRMLFLK